MKILLLEDDLPTAFLFNEMLYMLGHRVTNVLEYGEDAFREVQVNPPNLILADIQLAGKMTGIEVAEVVRKVLSIPVLFLTALPERLPAAIHSQAHGFLLKSCTIEELEVAIQWTLANYDKERAYQDELEKEQILRQKAQRNHRRTKRHYNALLEDLALDLFGVDTAHETLKQMMEDYEEFLLVKYLQHYHGDMDIIARKLDISRATLYRKCQKYHLTEAE